MKTLIFALSFFSITQIAFAEISNSNELDFVKTGLKQAPIVQCPRPQKKYQDMLNQLDELKAKIKSEACNDKALSAINGQVVDLEKLIVNGRVDFVELVKKGTSADQQLSAKEVESLKSYIDSVVKKVASVTGLLKNEACFDDGTKASTMSFLSSIIGEVSGAIGALTGPFGATISLGGQLAASLLGSVDTIIQARKTYDYSLFEDQKNYLNNLCAYYDFKSDLDKETAVFNYYDRVYELQETSDRFLLKLGEDCLECQNAIRDYNQLSLPGERFVIERRSDGQASQSDVNSSYDIGELDRNEVAASEAVVAASGEFEAVTASDITFRELSELLYEDFSEPVVVEDALEEPVVVSDPSVFSPREMTIRALQARSWSEAEINALEKSDSEGITDDGRREVMRVQKQLEDLLIDREAVNYIRYYSDLLLKDFKRIKGVTNDIRTQFYFWEVKSDKNIDATILKDSTVLAIHDLFRSDLDFAIVLTQYFTTEEYNAYINASKRFVLEALEPIRVDYGILSKRCQFFSKSLFKDKESTRFACERMESRRKEIKEFFVALKDTSFSVRYSKFLSFVDESDENEVEDWLASVTETFQLNLYSM